jgi:DNA-directed RNA polymerase specialized sigma24 family protein
MATEYLNNKAFEDIIERFMAAKKNARRDQIEYNLSAKDLTDAFYLLAENIIRAFNFQLIDKDDALQEGVMICFEKVDRFNPNYIGKNGQKAKAFNYLTTCCLNHYRQLYRTAKNYIELKKRYQDFITKKQLEIYESSSMRNSGRPRWAQKNTSYLD